MTDTQLHVVTWAFGYSGKYIARRSSSARRISWTEQHDSGQVENLSYMSHHCRCQSSRTNSDQSR